MLLKSIEDEPKKGLLRIMLAFFTRPRGTVRGDEAYEFTHKSFAEFLVARRIVEELDTLADGFLKANLKQFWNPELRLVNWAALCGPTSLDYDLMEFIAEATRLRGAKRANDWLVVLGELLSEVARQGMPMHTMVAMLKPQATFQVMNDWALRAELTMLTVMSLCGDTSRTRIRVEGLPEAIEMWLPRIWWYHETTSLNWLDLSGLKFRGRNLSGLPLVDVSLRAADLTAAHLGRAILFEADLSGANFERASLAFTELFDANLTSANLTGARLHHTFIENADLSGVTGVTLLELARHTVGDPSKLPDGKRPVKGWREKELAAAKRKSRKPAGKSRPPGPPPSET